MKYSSGLVFFCLFSAHIYADGSFDISAGVVLGHDSNVAVDEIDLFTAHSDNFITGRFGLGYENAFDDAQSFDLSYQLSDQHYADNQQFDLQNHLASVGYKLKYDKFTFGLTLRYVHSNLNSSHFLTLSQISPSVSWFISKRHYMRFSYTYHDKTLESNPARDANSDELSTDYYYFENGLNSYFIVSGKVREEDAIDSLFNYSSQQLRVAYHKRFDVASSPLKATIELRARRRDYNDEVNPEIEGFRLDKSYSSSLSLEWELAKHWLLEWQIEYSDRQSNLDSVDYSQWLIEAGFEYRF